MMMENPRVKANLDAVSKSTLISFTLDYLCSGDTATFSVGGVSLFILFGLVLLIFCHAFPDDSYFFIWVLIFRNSDGTHIWIN